MNNDSKNQGKDKSGKKRKSLSALFSSEKFLLVLSLVISFGIWVGVSASSGETVSYTVSDIPLDMELSDDAVEDGLTVVSVDGVSVDEYTASVRVSGNSITVGSLTSSDLQVYGTNLGNIVASGTYNVTLAARSQGVKSNYSILSVSPSEVTVVVDRNIEKEFTIESKITANTPSEYYMGSPTFSSKSVIVSGPELSVSQIASVAVSMEVENELTETTTIENQKVILLDSNGDEIVDDSLIIEPATVDVTIPVLVKKTVPIELACENQPLGLNIDDYVTISPEEIEIAASADIIDSISSIEIGTLDFTTLDYSQGEQTLTFDVVMPEGVRNLNSIETVSVTFDFSDISTTTLEVTSFRFLNVPDGYEAAYSEYSSIQVKVIGLTSQIENITADNLQATVDMTNATMGSSDMTVDVSTKGMTSCWIYGTYSITVTVSEYVDTGTDSETDTSLADSEENDGDTETSEESTS